MLSTPIHFEQHALRMRRHADSRIRALYSDLGPIDPATVGYSLRQRSAGVMGKGTNALADEGRRLPGMTASSPPHPSPPEEREIESSGGRAKMRLIGPRPQIS